MHFQEDYFKNQATGQGPGPEPVPLLVPRPSLVLGGCIGSKVLWVE